MTNCLFDSAFSDVAPAAWYADAVDYISENQIMIGTGDNKFSPDASMTRAMVVQTLYNRAGKPAVSGDAAFTDVSTSDWYYDAVQWAKANNVASGVGNGKFNPNGKVTRQEFAQFLYNNAGKPSVSGSLSQFPDAGKVSVWANDALVWATRNGIVSGSKDNGNLYLKPQDNAARAEAASMLMNYLEA